MITRARKTRAGFRAIFVAGLLGAITLLATVALGVWTPKITRAVTDLAGVLSPGAERVISNGLHKHRKKTRVQMAVLVIDSTKGEPIDAFAHRVAVAWGGGSREKSNGVLYVLAIKDRRGRIEVGYGLENKLSDKRAKKILASVRPHLKRGNYGQAVAGVVNGVIARTGGSKSAIDLSSVRQAKRQTSRQPATPAPASKRTRKKSGGGFGFSKTLIVILFIGFVFLLIIVKVIFSVAKNKLVRGVMGGTGYGGGYGRGYGGSYGSYGHHSHHHHHHHNYNSGNDWCAGSSSSSSWSSGSSWDDDDSSSWSDDSSVGGSDDWDGGGGDFGGGGASDSW